MEYQKCPDCGHKIQVTLPEAPPISPAELMLDTRSVAFEDAIASASDRTQELIETLIGHAEHAGETAKEFAGVLKESSGGLSDRRVQGANLSAIINILAASTEKALRRTMDLEARLAESSKEIDELRDQVQEARTEAMTDPLTGIANRNAFDRQLYRACERARKDRTPLSLLLIDIDHFKRFNDKHGHQVGDAVLRKLASALTSSIKGRDTAARWGGEEFAIILPETRDENAAKLAETIRHGVNQVPLKDGATGRTYGSVSISVGVTSYRSGEDLGTLLKRADEALYRAKTGGRNRVCVSGS